MMNLVSICFVRPITNFDEITFHFIECIHEHLRNSKLQVLVAGADLIAALLTVIFFMIEIVINEYQNSQFICV